MSSKKEKIVYIKKEDMSFDAEAGYYREVTVLPGAKCGDNCDLSGEGHTCNIPFGRRKGELLNCGRRSVVYKKIDPLYADLLEVEALTKRRE